MVRERNKDTLVSLHSRLHDQQDAPRPRAAEIAQGASAGKGISCLMRQYRVCLTKSCQNCHFHASCFSRLTVDHRINTYAVSNVCSELRAFDSHASEGSLFFA
jgi:hypothetical protein